MCVVCEDSGDSRWIQEKQGCGFYAQPCGSHMRLSCNQCVHAPEMMECGYISQMRRQQSTTNEGQPFKHATFHIS